MCYWLGCAMLREEKMREGLTRAEEEIADVMKDTGLKKEEALDS